jgi:hypothetical protein
MKWANSDDVRELLVKLPQIEGLLDAHVREIDLALQEKQQGIIDPGGQVDQQTIAPTAAPVPGQPGGGAPAPAQPAPQGAALALRNSNRNSTAATIAGMPGNRPAPPAVEWPQPPQQP